MLRDDRQYFKPFNYPWAYDKWLKHEQSHWLHTEVPMLEDVKDWKKKLTDAEKNFLTNIQPAFDMKSSMVPPQDGVRWNIFCL